MEPQNQDDCSATVSYVRKSSMFHVYIRSRVLITSLCSFSREVRRSKTLALPTKFGLNAAAMHIDLKEPGHRLQKSRGAFGKITEC